MNKVYWNQLNCDSGETLRRPEIWEKETGGNNNRVFNKMNYYQHVEYFVSLLAKLAPAHYFSQYLLLFISTYCLANFKHSSVISIVVVTCLMLSLWSCFVWQTEQNQKIFSLLWYTPQKNCKISHLRSWNQQIICFFCLMKQLKWLINDQSSWRLIFPWSTYCFSSIAALSVWLKTRFTAQFSHPV